MLEFPTARNDWRLDVVSILAVVGESNIKIHVQPLTATSLCLLPRLIPAPQAFLREKRPRTLPYEEDILVVDVSGKATKNGLNYFANLLLLANLYAPYSVYEFNISENEQVRTRGRSAGPLNTLTILSTLTTLGLLIWSILIHDGVACLAIIIMSLASSAFGFSCLWRPAFSKGTYAGKGQSNDTKVIIRTRSEAFVVVNGSQDLLREVFFAAEECIYIVKPILEIMLVGVGGSVLLSAGVVLLGNSSWVMQVAIGVFYTLLNVMYWILATLPTRYAWDLSRYRLDQCSSTRCGNFTTALWQAILVTQSIKWVGPSGALPLSEGWRLWLREARRNMGNPKWDYEATLAQNLAHDPDPYSISEVQ